MAKNILKLTEGQAIVKINGTGTETITLATELLSPTQIIDGTPTVGIQFLQWSTGGSILVQRNSATIFEMYNGSGVMDLSGHWGAIDNTYATHDITVTITGGGTCLLSLRKSAGYTSKIEPWAYGQYDNPNVVGS
jgi:hypothetical protein